MRKFAFLIILLLSISSLVHAGQLSCESLFQAKSKKEISRDLAIQAGLHYSLKKEPGYSREEIAGPTIKGSKRPYIYQDPNGHPVEDVEVLNRIEALVIPPGYSHVWIAVDPLAHIQVRGLDAAKRSQSKYHDIWTSQVLTRAKFTRMRDFGLSISKLRDAVDYDLNKESIDKKSKIAAVIRLLEVAGIRIGGEKYAKTNASFGLSTLRVSHLVALSPQIRFQFIAKEGKPQDILIDSPSVARILEESLKDKNTNDKLFSVTAADVNAYIKEKIGSSFSAKDFRTWVGTTVAAKELHLIGSKDSREQQLAAVSQASLVAANRLNNTAPVALDYYIDPVIVEAYLNHQIDDAFKFILDPDLSPEENAVLYLTR